MLPRSRLGSVRIAVVSLALLLAACAAPASSRQLGATTAPTPQGLSTALAVLPATAPPTLPPTAELAPSAVPTPPDLPTVAPTAAPTAAPSPAPTVAPPVEAGPPAGLPTGMVERVIDGDTVDVRLGGDTVRVRLIGIDTPEVVDPRTPVECFGREASAKAHELLDGQSVAIEDDPTQGDADRYGRLLRYLWLPDGRLFNQEMIGQGYAFEYTYDQPYAYQAQFRQAQQEAREAQRGLWSPQACNGEHRPAEVAQPRPIPAPTRTPRPPKPSPAPAEQPKPAASCDPSYPDVCIPPPPPDLDCPDISYRRFRVLPPDPHRFDGDHDGIGCER